MWVVRHIKAACTEAWPRKESNFPVTAWTKHICYHNNLITVQSHYKLMMVSLITNICTTVQYKELYNTFDMYKRYTEIQYQMHKQIHMTSGKDKKITQKLYSVWSISTLISTSLRCKWDLNNSYPLCTRTIHKTNNRGSLLSQYHYMIFVGKRFHSSGGFLIFKGIAFRVLFSESSRRVPFLKFTGP